MDVKRVLAWPKSPMQRAMFETVTGRPLPSYPDSVEQPCSQCGMALLVPPRSRARLEDDDVELWCTLCAIDDLNRPGAPAVTVSGLGNPDAQFVWAQDMTKPN